MASLRRRMAEYGFESNDDYEYQLRCFFQQPTSGLRCLNIEGRSARRQTALANALAHALQYDHVLSHDFSDAGAAEPVVRPVKADDDESEIPISQFDRSVSEACAFSEAEKTILIVDQLQAADFKHHIRLNEFVRTHEWSYTLATLTANPKNFLLILVSEEPLYHSLQNVCYRLWADSSNTHLQFKPKDFDLPETAAPMLTSMGELFVALGVTPTFSEFEKIIFDIQNSVRTDDYLRHSIYGWTEGVDRDALFSRELEPRIAGAMQAIQQYVGIDEIEISID